MEKHHPSTIMFCFLLLLAHCSLVILSSYSPSLLLSNWMNAADVPSISYSLCSMFPHSGRSCRPAVILVRVLTGGMDDFRQRGLVEEDTDMIADVSNRIGLKNFSKKLSSSRTPLLLKFIL